jgi:hypothetical protein
VYCKPCTTTTTSLEMCTVFCAWSIAVFVKHYDTLSKSAYNIRMHCEQSSSQVIPMDHEIRCSSDPPSRTNWTWSCGPIALSSCGDHKTFARVALFPGLMTYLEWKSAGAYVQSSYMNTSDRSLHLTPAVTRRLKSNWGSHLWSWQMS